MSDISDALASAARGGRVAHSPFLEPEAADALAAALRAAGVQAGSWGGFAGARRRVVTAFPSHVPNATTALAGVYLAGAGDEHALRAGARAAGVPADALGDVVRHADGLSIVTFDPPPEALMGLRRLEGRPVEPRTVPVEKISAGAQRRIQVVVPSLRIDVLGGKAFKVSRSYFAKGVAAGRVRVNGREAAKSATATEGDEVFADGLGRFRVLSVDGETRRGNLRVTLESERA